MRNISFALTTAQFLDGSKTVTRRTGWSFLKAGTHLMGVKKCMGFRPGEKVEYLGELEVLSVTRERLEMIDQADCVREGFPEVAPLDFIAMFCKFHKECTPSTEITRIEFRKVTKPEPPPYPSVTLLPGEAVTFPPAKRRRRGYGS